MIDNLFIFKLGLSFLAGSLWITMGTVVAERYGTKIGGLVAGLPSTILISLFFIAWTQSNQAAVEATTLVPIIGGINCLFIVVYVFLIRIHFWLAFIAALSVWSLCSYSLVLSKFTSFPLSFLAYIGLLLFSYFIVERRLKLTSEEGRKMVYTLPVILLRAIFSGFVILVAVVMTRLGGPLIGGMFAMFPAMFISTLFITFFSHGPLFSAAVMKASILGAISVVIYGVAARYTYLSLGLWPGTFLSLALSFGASFLIHRFMLRKTA